MRHGRRPLSSQRPPGTPFSPKLVGQWRRLSGRLNNFTPDGPTWKPDGRRDRPAAHLLQLVRTTSQSFTRTGLTSALGAILRPGRVWAALNPPIPAQVQLSCATLVMSA